MLLPFLVFSCIKHVSLPCRTVVPYAFVDVDKVKGMRGIYVATQLTPGPVGKRHLLSLITYNRGATWQRIPSPTKDIRGGRIYCYPVSVKSNRYIIIIEKKALVVPCREIQ